MEEQAPQDTQAQPRSRQDRWVKLGFLLVAIATVAVIWWIQRNPPMLADWADDLSTALDQARREDRRVLVFFMHSPPGQTERWLVSNTIPKNDKHIKGGNYIAVKASVSKNLKDELAEQYGIREVPTLLILDPQGKEIGRRTGRVGEIDFGRFLREPNSPRP